MTSRLNSLDRLRRCPRVEIVDDEREMGDGVIVTLRQGWSFDQLADNRVRGEDTPSQALKAVRYAHPFAGPYHA
jgi:hypothetical protein